MAGEVLSKGAYAIARGKMPSWLSNNLARGKLTADALTSDGRILVEEADRQLGLAIDPGRGRPAAAPLAVNDPATSLAEVRLQRERLNLEAQERNAAIERGELVRVDEVTRAWAKEIEDLLLSIEQFMVDLPGKFGLGRDAIDIARREWREFRARRAEQAASLAPGAGAGKT